LHRNLTQDRLAALAGLDGKTISRIETGTMSPILDHLLDLADALDVPPASLLPERLAD
jgi:transcriptional regulator with XRE-family HTH domain